jgi:hypothetical protein
MEKQYFKVGDLVTCLAYGKGEVVNINKNAALPLTVKYGKWFINYTFDGGFTFETKRTLHQGHIDIPEPELKEIVTFEIGEIVWGMDKYGAWYCVKFAEFETYITSNMFNGYHPQKTDDVYNWETFHNIKKYEDRPF